MQSRFVKSYAKESSDYVADRRNKTRTSSPNWQMHDSLRRIHIDEKGAFVELSGCQSEIFILRKIESKRLRNLKGTVRTSHYEDKRWLVFGDGSQLKTWVRKTSLCNVVKFLCSHTHIAESTETFKQKALSFEATEYRHRYFCRADKFKTRERQKSRIPALEYSGGNERHKAVGWNLRGISESQLFKTKPRAERTENLDSYFCFVAGIS